MIRTIVSKTGIGDITDTNKDWYVSICKAIYENHEEYKVISKYSKIGEIKRPKGKRVSTVEQAEEGYSIDEQRRKNIVEKKDMKFSRCMRIEG